MRKRRRRRNPRKPIEHSYDCPTCGETIVIPVDVSQGEEQEYVEDCPVCCHPNLIRVQVEPDGRSARVWADSE